jgi:hypothetical protein
VGAKDYVGEKAHGVKEALVGSAHHVKDATAEKLTEAKEYVEGKLHDTGAAIQEGLHGAKVCRRMPTAFPTACCRSPSTPQEYASTKVHEAKARARR